MHCAGKRLVKRLHNAQKLEHQAEKKLQDLKQEYDGRVQLSDNH